MNTRTTLRRRSLLAAAASVLLPWCVRAQSDWPQRPIRLVVPFAPGGSNDILARILGAKLGARLGQTVVIENKAGSGGTIGTDTVAKSAADGYTLLFASTSVTTNAASGKALPYDLFQDLQPIGLIGATPFVVVVSNAVQANTLAEFITLARTQPGALNYGTGGIGGFNQLGTELFAAAAHINMTHVPYRGMGPAFTDLMAGTLHMAFPTLASVLPHLRAGKMRALAVTSLARSALAPEIPTADEAGLPGFQLEAWFGLLAPAGLPAPILQRLNADLNGVLGDVDVAQALAREAITTQPGTPQAFTQLMHTELERWTALIRDQQIQIN